MGGVVTVPLLKSRNSQTREMRITTKQTEEGEAYGVVQGPSVTSSVDIVCEQGKHDDANAF
jgi:hypothetical protein